MTSKGRSTFKSFSCFWLFMTLSSDVVPLLLSQLPAGLSGSRGLVPVCVPGLPRHRAAAGEFQFRYRNVVFVFDVADDFFQHVFQRDEAEHPAFAVAHDRHRAVRLAEQAEHVRDRFVRVEERGRVSASSSSTTPDVLKRKNRSFVFTMPTILSGVPS